MSTFYSVCLTDWLPSDIFLANNTAADSKKSKNKEWHSHTLQKKKKLNIENNPPPQKKETKLILL